MYILELKWSYLTTRDSCILIPIDFVLFSRFWEPIDQNHYSLLLNPNSLNTNVKIEYFSKKIFFSPASVLATEKYLWPGTLPSAVFIGRVFVSSLYILFSTLYLLVHILFFVITFFHSLLLLLRFVTLNSPKQFHGFLTFGYLLWIVGQAVPKQRKYIYIQK